jgi:hypothetical protein
MIVRVAEVGDRPLIATAARLNAPQGAKVLADVLYDLDFCDDILLTLDWDKSVLAISAGKAYPSIRRRADIEVILDMEEAFQQDNFSLATVTETIAYLRSEFEKKNDEAKAMEGRV